MVFSQTHLYSSFFLANAIEFTLFLSFSSLRSNASVQHPFDGREISCVQSQRVDWMKRLNLPEGKLVLS